MGYHVLLTDTYRSPLPTFIAFYSWDSARRETWRPYRARTGYEWDGERWWQVLSWLPNSNPYRIGHWLARHSGLVIDQCESKTFPWELAPDKRNSKNRRTQEPQFWEFQRYWFLVTTWGRMEEELVLLFHTMCNVSSLLEVDPNKENIVNSACPNVERGSSPLSDGYGRLCYVVIGWVLRENPIGSKNKWNEVNRRCPPQPHNNIQLMRWDVSHWDVMRSLWVPSEST